MAKVVAPIAGSCDQNLSTVAKIPISLVSSASPVNAQMVLPAMHGLSPGEQIRGDQQNGVYESISEEAEVVALVAGAGNPNLVAVAEIPISLASSISPVKAQMILPVTYSLLLGAQFHDAQQEGEYESVSEEAEFQNSENVLGSLSSRQNSGKQWQNYIDNTRGKCHLRGSFH